MDGALEGVRAIIPSTADGRAGLEGVRDIGSAEPLALGRSDLDGAREMLADASRSNSEAGAKARGGGSGMGCMASVANMPSMGGLTRGGGGGTPESTLPIRDAFDAAREISADSCCGVDVEVGKGLGPSATLWFGADGTRCPD